MAENRLDKVHFVKNAVIFREGDDSEGSMFDIAEGIVGIYANYEQNHQKLLTTLKDGDYFGEMGLIEGARRSATAVALSDARIVRITEAEFVQYFQEQPNKILQIMRQMSGRIRELSQDYQDACNSIAEYLAAERSGAEKPGGLMERLRWLASRRKK